MKSDVVAQGILLRRLSGVAGTSSFLRKGEA